MCCSLLYSIVWCMCSTDFLCILLAYTTFSLKILFILYRYSNFKLSAMVIKYCMSTSVPHTAHVSIGTLNW